MEYLFHTVIPVNTTATIYTGYGGKMITESGLPLKKSPGVKLLKIEKGTAVLTVKSGSYH